MRISHYTSILVLACMLMGIGTSSIIYFQGQRIDNSQDRLQVLTLKHTEVQSINALMSHWLTTLDLYLINQQTYLFKALKEQGSLLIHLINKVDNQQLAELKRKVTAVTELCTKCQLSSNIHNEALWTDTIIKSDSITENIDQAVTFVDQKIADEIKLLNYKIQHQQSFQQTSSYILLSFLGAFTLLMLHWSNKRIASPLVALTKLTNKTDIKSDDFRVKGPKEVKDLSQKMGNYILALLKAREIALAESELTKYANVRIRNIMETAGDAIICADSEGNIIEMNESFRKLTELNINKSPSLKISDFIPSFELVQFDNEDSCMLISFVEATLYTANSQKIPVEISTSSFNSHDKRHFTVIIRDITERAEFTEKLLRAQKLESIGQLAAGIAHEINTPSQYIMDYNRFIKEGFESINDFIKATHELKNPQLEEMAEEMNLVFYEEEIPNAINGSLHGLEQISKIVKSVKDFSHPQKDEKVSYSINTIIQDTVNVSRNEWKYDAEVKLLLDKNLPNIQCFPVRLNQVILNLIVNSAQAIHESQQQSDLNEMGKITVSTEVIDQAVLIKLSDTGSGIPEEIRNKIFDPFFTTKEIGVGTGQGLALSYDFIVNKHNGQIDVQSEVGKGTEFTITLPIEEAFQEAC